MLRMAKLRLFNFSREVTDDVIEAFSQEMLGTTSHEVELVIVDGAVPSNRDSLEGGNHGVMEYPPTLRPPGPDERGQCTNLRQGSLVKIWVPNIRMHYYLYPGIQFGGNVTAAVDVPHAVLLVLAHELRHVQQYLTDGHPQWASELPYEDQPHEVDARRFVDEHELEILRFTKRLAA